MIPEIDGGGVTPPVVRTPNTSETGGSTVAGASLPVMSNRSGASTTSNAPLGSDFVDLGHSATRADMRSVTDGPRLIPNATIAQNGYTFTTDGQGRLVSASGTLQLKAPGETHRLPSFQTRVGGPDRLPTDVGGHLIGDQFRAPGYNVFPQNANFNSSAYARLENSWKASLTAGQTVHINDARLTYNDASTRPVALSVNYSVDGERYVRKFFNAAGGVEPTTLPSADAGALRAVAEHATSFGAGGGGSSALTDTGNGILRAVAADTPAAGRIAAGLDGLGKVAVPLGIATSAYELGSAFHADGNTIGTHTVEATGSVAGGWVGAEAGAEVGAEAGAAVGAAFGGVGAVPGAVVGGLVGGVVGGIVGSSAGNAIAGAAVSAGKSISGAASSVGKFVSSLF
jgi:hypothetical protein